MSECFINYDCVVILLHAPSGTSDSRHITDTYSMIERVLSYCGEIRVGGWGNIASRVG